MFSISVLAIVVLNFGIGDSQQQIMETQYLVDTMEIMTPDIRHEEQQITDSQYESQKKIEQKQYEEQLAEKLSQIQRKSVIKDTVSISQPLKQLESLPEEPEVMMSETLQPPEEPMLSESEQQVIVVQIPQQPQQGVDWKSLISWVIAALNGMVLLLMNIKNLKKK